MLFRYFCAVSRARAGRPPDHRPGAAPARRAAPATSAAGAGARPAAPGRLRPADRDRGASVRRAAPVEEAAELRQVYAEWPGQILSWLARQGTVPEANPRGPPAPAGAVARGARPALRRGSRVGPVHRADRRRGRGLSRTGRCRRPGAGAGGARDVAAGARLLRRSRLRPARRRGQAARRRRAAASVESPDERLVRRSKT